MSDRDVKIYVINFAAADVNIAALTRYLYDSVDVIAFWNYLPLVYCVKSRLRATELAVKLQSFITPRLFMVAEIDPTNLDGMLPTDAWGWFYLEHHQKGAAPNWDLYQQLLGISPPKIS